MRRLLAALLAASLNSASFAQVAEVRLGVYRAGSAPAFAVSPLKLSLSGPLIPLKAPALQAPSLGQIPSVVPAARPVAAPEGYVDPGHWGAQNIIDREYAALLEEGSAKISVDGVRPAVLETLRAKDGKVFSHMMRVGILSGLIALAMGGDAETVRRTAWAARLHDIGKSEDAILAAVNKEGKLTAAERDLVNTHPQAGVDILFRQTDIPYDLHWPAMRAALSHHETMDGKGYPQGLKGEEIPLEGRITTVADYFDALLEHRPYRAGMTVAQALAIMEKVKDKFDPRVWTAFLGVVHG